MGQAIKKNFTKTLVVFFLLSSIIIGTNASGKTTYIKNTKTINAYTTTSTKSKIKKIIKASKKNTIKITKQIKKDKTIWLKSKFGYIKKTKNIKFVKAKVKVKKKKKAKVKKKKIISKTISSKTAYIKNTKTINAYTTTSTKSKIKKIIKASKKNTIKITKQIKKDKTIWLKSKFGYIKKTKNIKFVKAKVKVKKKKKAKVKKKKIISKTISSKTAYIKNTKTINAYTTTSTKSKIKKIIKASKKNTIKITKQIKKDKTIWLKSKFGYIKKTKNIKFVKAKVKVKKKKIVSKTKQKTKNKKLVKKVKTTPTNTQENIKKSTPLAKIDKPLTVVAPIVDKVVDTNTNTLPKLNNTVSKNNKLEDDIKESTPLAVVAPIVDKVVDTNTNTLPKLNNTVSKNNKLEDDIKAQQVSSTSNLKPIEKSQKCSNLATNSIKKGEFYFYHQSSATLNKAQKINAKKLGIATSYDKEYDTNGVKFYGNCTYCHTTSKDNDITTLGTTFSKSYAVQAVNKPLFEYIHNPKQQNPNSQMPFYSKILDEKEICYIVSFIESLK